VNVGALTAGTGAAQGTGTGGTVAATAISVSNTAAAGNVTTGAISTVGGLKGLGGNVVLASATDVTVGGTIQIGGGAGVNSAGMAAGTLTITGVNRSVTGAITASGGAGSGVDQAGGAAGVVSIAGTTGTLSLAGVTARTGAATGTGAGGTAGSMTLNGTTVSSAALTTTGGANGDGGTITATATTGLLNVTGAITTSGGVANANTAGPNAGNVTLTGDSVTTLGVTANGANGSGLNFAGGTGGNVSVTGTGGAVSVGAISTIGGNGVTGDAAGGNAGTITLDAGGAATITLGGNLTATGGNRVGVAAAGAGAQIQLKDPVLLNAVPMTIAAGGGSAGVGAGGNVQFDGTVDSTGGARALTVNTNANTIFGAPVGAGAALLSLVTDAGGTTQINGGSITTTGNMTYNDAVTTSGATTLTTTGAGNIAANNPGNDFNGDLVLSTSGSASIVDSNALALGTSSVGTLTAQTMAGDLVLNGAITASGGGDSIVLASAQDLVNNVGAGVLNPGAGRWLVYSTSPAGSTENGLTGAAGSAMPRLYNRTIAGNPPGSISEPGNHLIYSATPNLTVTSENKSKVYGADDPAQTYVAMGYVSDDGVTDTAVTAGLTGSFGRVAGESVGVRAATQGTFASNAGYGISFTAGSGLTITQASLTARLTNPAQTKVYGEDDPALPGVGVTLGGLINRTVSTWNGNVAVSDGALISNATSLARAVGENVGSYAITGGTFTAPTANYNAPAFDGSNSPALAITPAPLTIRADDKTRDVGLSNPPFTATYNGFVFGETPVMLTGSLSFATPAVIASPAGNYPIVPSGQTSSNYAISYFNGTLTVSASPAVPVPPAVPAVIGSSIFGPQIAALEQLGIGVFRDELSGCVGGASLSGSAGVRVLAVGWGPSCGAAGGDELTEIAPPDNRP
jgi:hypothetical protein